MENIDPAVSDWDATIGRINKNVEIACFQLDKAATMLHNYQDVAYNIRGSMQVLKELQDIIINNGDPRKKQGRKKDLERLVFFLLAFYREK